MTRRPRQPRPLVNPIACAMDGARLLAETERALRIDPTTDALTALRTGTGRGDAWRALADALNLAEALVELGIVSDRMDQVQCGQDALAQLAHRVGAGRSWTLYGHELVALDQAMWVYATQLKFCCVSEWNRAFITVQNRIGAALAGNGGPRVTVHPPRSLA